jgi:hypothetical protein
LCIKIRREALFTLDKEILEFNVKCGKSTSIKSLSEKPLTQISVRNISRFAIAMRVKTFINLNSKNY